MLRDLRRELARRREDQRARLAARQRRELLEDGQRERGRFAGARLGAGEDVLAREGRRDRGSLNGGRDGEAELTHGTKGRRAEAQRVKSRLHRFFRKRAREVDRSHFERSRKVGRHPYG